MTPKIFVVIINAVESSDKGFAAQADAKLIAGLRQRIRSGQYAAGSWLPTERELSEEFGVTRRVVRRAIDRLAEEGLVRCRARFRPIVEASAVTLALTQTPPKATEGTGSRLVALLMWQGDPVEQAVTAQQQVFWGMSQRLARDNYHGVFLNLGDRVGTELENAEREAAHLRYVLDQGFAGIVFYPYAYRRNRDLLLRVARAMPLVLIDRWMPGVQSDFVGVDNHRAMYDATQHLITLGHRRILFATTSEFINTVQDRAEGYRQAMNDAPGGPLSESFLTVPPRSAFANWSVFEGLFQLPREQRPTAILCVNDYVALDVYRQLCGMGIEVPEEVAVCGFDNIITALPNGVGLTTVAQPFERIGDVAADLVLTRSRAARANPSALFSDVQHVELPADLVIRASTAPVLAPQTL